MKNKIKNKKILEFTHLNKKGDVQMVDVTNKMNTERIAKAEGFIFVQKKTYLAIKNNSLPKGNVLTVAKIAAIQAAKKTSEIIPLCHQLNLSFVNIEFDLNESSILIKSEVKTKESTGVEMEALIAVTAAALTIYDMCKSVDKKMQIREIKLTEKKGGKSDFAVDYRPKVGIITLSDSVFAGKRKDISGKILIDGFTKAGCKVAESKIMEDGSIELIPTIKKWIKQKVELIITTGGTGLGPRDLTIKKIENIFDSRLPGVEQALHSYGRGKIKTSMLSRLAAGVVKDSILIALPGSPNAVTDALQVLIPVIFHSYHMMRGERH